MRNYVGVGWSLQPEACLAIPNNFSRGSRLSRDVIRYLYPKFARYERSAKVLEMVTRRPVAVDSIKNPPAQPACFPRAARYSKKPERNSWVWGRVGSRGFTREPRCHDTDEVADPPVKKIMRLIISVSSSKQMCYNFTYIIAIIIIGTLQAKICRRYFALSKKRTYTSILIYLRI